MRYLAIDLGEKRTGLALGDSVTGIVTPLEVIEHPAHEHAGPARLHALARHIDAALGAGELVIGLPLNMDGTEGPAARRARAAAAELARLTGRAVHLHDERLSSAQADWALAGSGLTRGQKKQRRDAVAAAAILRDFLASRSAPPPGPGQA
jgi:putative holliday junction resolvase